MHASTSNLITCSHPDCSQPGTVTVHTVVLSATRRYQNGEAVPVEVELDWCERHRPEDD